MLKKIWPLFSVFLLTGLVWAGVNGAYKELQVQPVAELDGDTIITTQITLVNNAATLIDAGNPTIPLAGGTWEQESIRRRTIENVGTSAVFIGSNTATLNTMGYEIFQATSTQPAVYSTWNTGPIYGECATGTSGCIVAVIKETNATY